MNQKKLSTEALETLIREIEIEIEHAELLSECFDDDTEEKIVSFA